MVSLIDSEKQACSPRPGFYYSEVLNYVSSIDDPGRADREVVASNGLKPLPNHIALFQITIVPESLRIVPQVLTSRI